jgi:cysteine desulfuration protein SufE
MSAFSIDQRQADILLEISGLNGDTESILRYLVEQGRAISPLSEADKTEENRLQSCHSKVWMTSCLENERVYFFADSNTAITKGLLRLLLRILNGQRPETILDADLSLLQEKNLQRFIGTQRTNGLATLVKQMKAGALAFHCQP